MKPSKPFFVWSLLLPLPLAALVMVPLLWSAKKEMAAGKTDFSDLYAAAYIVKEGQGHLLYNDEAQAETKSRLFPDGRTERTHNHLAFEALFLVPLAFLPYPAALIAWLVLNLGFLVRAIHQLERHLPRLRASLGVPLLLPCLGFYPIGQTIFEGQDSIVILILYIAAFVCFRSNRPFLAGVSLAFALFKFHLVLPTIFLLLMYRERKAVLGFLSAASLVVGLSILVAGFYGTVQFAGNLIATNSALTDSANRARFALNPTAYSNIRGLVYWAIGQQTTDSVLLTIIVVTSVFLLVVAGFLGNRVPPDLRFSLAIVVTTLVSFHLYYHDVSIMLIPIFVGAEAALAGRRNQILLGVSFAILMLAPLYPLSYLYNLASLMSVPIAAVGLCLATGLQNARTTQTPATVGLGA